MTARFRFAAALLLCTAIAVGAAKPASVKVEDKAGLFKAETVAKANDAIEALGKKGIRLAVETYPTVPKESIDKVKEMKAAEREKFYQEWALGRVKELGDNTILILLTNEPKHLETAVGADARNKFAPEARKALTDAMLGKLRKMQVDEALLDAVATLRKHFDVPAKDNP